MKHQKHKCLLAISVFLSLSVRYVFFVVNNFGVTGRARSPKGAAFNSPGREPWASERTTQYVPRPGLTPWTIESRPLGAQNRGLRPSAIGLRARCLIRAPKGRLSIAQGGSPGRRNIRFVQGLRPGLLKPAPLGLKTSAKGRAPPVPPITVGMGHSATASR